MVQLERLIEVTDAEIEQRAHEYLRSRVDVQFRIPVNVEALLDCMPDVEVHYVPGMIFCGYEGCICKPDFGKNLRVYIDKWIADYGQRSRYLAVVAEELSHLVLHQSVFIQVRHFRDFREVQNSPHWRRMERDAKRFSAAIRMPFKNLVLKAEELYPQLVDEHGYSEWQLQTLLRNALAEKFEVPPDDMDRRLQEWPCNIYERVAISSHAKLDRLVASDAVLRVIERRKQTKFNF